MKKKIAIIGAGPMGLTCAYYLLKKGNNVSIFEKDDVIGGMSSSFDFDGLRLEKFYHFICGPDYPFFALLKELNIYNRIRWNETRMGFFYNGKLYKWGNPIYLLMFPVNLFAKLKYGLHIFLSSKRNKWQNLDKVNAITWLKKWLGEKAYKIFWESLLHLKFYELKHEISAAWIWSRIKRVALSRKNIFVEKMGYLEGGSDVFLNAISENIRKMGGNIYLTQNVKKILIANHKIEGLIINDKKKAFDTIISTIPLPYLKDLAPTLPQEILSKIKNIKNIGVICLIVKLKNKLTENFWMNINDKDIKIPGIIEYSNLRPLENNILYIPYYMPQTHPDWTKSDNFFYNQTFKYFKKINKDFNENWIINKKIFRLKYAQPVCTKEYLKNIPDTKTNVTGLYIADTSYCYPEDRSISESINLGQKIASLVS
ncbi:hypothetical protein A2272_00520 [Candidatus Peregrinibacteria bacterium RIFOXYA12_FULL_33_12]|nr:MAG: hypothetical protein A2272_00520 [Candidatus Peregrinibacteria bacterium RIFOXYA12_FULL_33_12]